MNKEKKQVLLCGTQYGQTYLPAIYQTKEFELAGILAQGSDRSLRLAEQHGVALYGEPDEIDQEIDVACVAINEHIATPLANILLQQGMDVLIEHPINISNMKQLVASAERYENTCHINTHFANLPPITDFIRLCRKCNQNSHARIINIQCNSRTLFSTLDILMRCFGQFKVNGLAIQSVDHYRNCTLRINDIPATLVYQQWRYEQDNSTDSPLGHQITITYPEGVLSLGGTFGPCLWFPLIAVGVSKTQPIYHLNHQAQSSTVDVATMMQWRKNANQRALQELISTTTPFPHHSYSRSLYLCDLWTHLFNQLGMEVLNPRTNLSVE